MKIVADENIPFLKGVLEPFAEVIYLPGKQIDREALKDADALLTRTRTKCTPSLLRGTGVKFIGTATIGFDHIDIDFCRKNRIVWNNAPGCNSSSVQQYIAAALLKIALDFKTKLKGKTIGLVGVGNVGSKVETLARLLEMNLLLNDPPRARKEGNNSFGSLETVLNESDIITVHVPLNIVGEDCTWHLFDDMNFKKMRRGTWFINTSRGEVTEMLPLKNVLESGKLRGAVIDVWENEPDIDRGLIESTFISTPHIAGYSTDGKANGTSMVVNSLCRFFNLPLKNWYPGNIPGPANPIISIDCKGKTDEEVLREAVFQTYNIDEDNIRFRASPADFEKQRGDYPVRREFTSYRVILKGGTKQTRIILKGLGFKVV